jgi:hypothetical protein
MESFNTKRGGFNKKRGYGKAGPPDPYSTSASTSSIPRNLSLNNNNSFHHKILKNDSHEYHIDIKAKNENNEKTERDNMNGDYTSVKNVLHRNIDIESYKDADMETGSVLIDKTGSVLI